MNQILLIIAITIGFSTLNIEASGQNGNEYKMIDSTIYSYKRKDFITKRSNRKIQVPNMFIIKRQNLCMRFS